MAKGASFSSALTAARPSKSVRRASLLDRLRDRGDNAADTAHSQRREAAKQNNTKKLRTTILATVGLAAAGGILWYALAGPSIDTPTTMEFRIDPQERVDHPPAARSSLSLAPPSSEGRPPSRGTDSAATIPVDMSGMDSDGGSAMGTDGGSAGVGNPTSPGARPTGPLIPSPSAVRTSMTTVTAGLVPAPVLELLENSPEGPLPVRAPDGRTPLDVYARSTEIPPDQPRLALVLADFGLSGSFSSLALDQLPADVTFALSPLAGDPADWATRARSDGHEILVGVPMEPADYPLTDPGPNTLLTNLGPAENLTRLHRALTEAPGAIGVVPIAGGAFTASEDALAPIIGDLAARGLMALDTRTALNGQLRPVAARANLPFVRIDAVVGETLANSAIDARLLALEAIARRDGVAVGWLIPKPIVVERIVEWANTLPDRGVSLSPLSAVTLRPGQGIP